MSARLRQLQAMPREALAGLCDPSRAQDWEVLLVEPSHYAAHAARLTGGTGAFVPYPIRATLFNHNTGMIDYWTVPSLADPRYDLSGAEITPEARRILDFLAQGG